MYRGSGVSDARVARERGRKLVKGEKRDGSMHRGWSKHRGVGG